MSDSPQPPSPAEPPEPAADAQPRPPPADATVMAPAGAEPAPVRPAPGTKPLLVKTGTLINNNYRILDLVSAGGMGEVYRAENVFTGDPVAVKVILPGLADDKAVLDLFRREARVLVQLRDDAIVRYHNFVLDPGLGRYCLIMEYVEGRHLGARLKYHGRLPDSALLVLLRRLATGLARAHDSGVTHRDLSPDNVILRDDRIEEAVLIDFGIARSTELGDGLAGRFAGKFKYIAPEQLGHWGGEIGPVTDVYGLALLIAAVARGKPLEMGDSVVSASAMRGAIPDLSGISHRLFPLLQHMLEPDPAQRPPGMAAVLAMLDDPSRIPSRYRLPLWQDCAAEEAEAEAGAVTGSGLGASLGGPLHSASPFGSTPPPAAEPTADAPPPAPSRRWPLIGGGILLLAGIGGLGWVMLNPLEPSGALPEAATTSAADLPPRDASTREGFLATQALPPCATVLRITSGANAGQLQFIGRDDLQPQAVAAAYDARFGVSPGVQQTMASAAQCPALAFLREVSGRPAPPLLLRAEASAANQQLQVRGALEAGPDRNLWLWLVPPSGEVYDLSAQLAAAAAGARDFGFALALGGQAPGSYLLVALATEAPLAAVAAAPSGTPADELLPRVLDELRASGQAPAVAVQVIDAP